MNISDEGSQLSKADSSLICLILQRFFQKKNLFISLVHKCCTVFVY